MESDRNIHLAEGVKDHRTVSSKIDEYVDNEVYPFIYARVEDLDGNLVYEHGAHNEKFRPDEITADSWIRIWSMSKMVTIVTILGLEEEGILSRHDMVTQYIPEFKDMTVAVPESGKTIAQHQADNDLKGACPINIVPAKGEMTIEDLLDHKGGFFYPVTGVACIDQLGAKAQIADAQTSDDLIKRLASIPLSGHPGQDYQYGPNTTILTVIAERALDKPFDEILRERITDPLGISDSLTYRLPEGAELPPKIVGKGNPLRFAGPNDLDIFGGSLPRNDQDLQVFLGGEGMVGTTRAYARFARMVGNYGELDGIRYLKKETIEDMVAPRTLESEYGHNGFNVWVSNGFMGEGKPSGKPGLWIGGGYEGTAFWIDPDLGYVGFLMSQVYEAAHAPMESPVDDLRCLIYDSILYQR